MEDVIALRGTTNQYRDTFFLTWGRIQDPDDFTAVETLVLHHSRPFQTPGRVVGVQACRFLSEAASAPLFYEGLLYFAQRPVPSGEAYEEWRRERAVEMELGHEIFAVGPFE